MKCQHREGQDDIGAGEGDEFVPWEVSVQVYGVTFISSRCGEGEI